MRTTKGLPSSASNEETTPEVVVDPIQPPPATQVLDGSAANNVPAPKSNSSDSAAKEHQSTAPQSSVPRYKPGQPSIMRTRSFSKALALSSQKQAVAERAKEDQEHEPEATKSQSVVSNRRRALSVGAGLRSSRGKGPTVNQKANQTADTPNVPASGELPVEMNNACKSLQSTTASSTSRVEPVVLPATPPIVNPIPPPPSTQMDARSVADGLQLSSKTGETVSEEDGMVSKTVQPTPAAELSNEPSATPQQPIEPSSAIPPSVAPVSVQHLTKQRNVASKTVQSTLATANPASNPIDESSATGQQHVPEQRERAFKKQQPTVDAMKPVPRMHHTRSAGHVESEHFLYGELPPPTRRRRASKAAKPTFAGADASSIPAPEQTIEPSTPPIPPSVIVAADSTPPPSTADLPLAAVMPPVDEAVVLSQLSATSTTQISTGSEAEELLSSAMTEQVTHVEPTADRMKPPPTSSDKPDDELSVEEPSSDQHSSVTSEDSMPVEQPSITSLSSVDPVQPVTPVQAVPTAENPLSISTPSDTPENAEGSKPPPKPKSRGVRRKQQKQLTADALASQALATEVALADASVTPHSEPPQLTKRVRIPKKPYDATPSDKVVRPPSNKRAKISKNAVQLPLPSPNLPTPVPEPVTEPSATGQQQPVPTIPPNVTVTSDSAPPPPKKRATVSEKAQRTLASATLPTPASEPINKPSAIRQQPVPTTIQPSETVTPESAQPPKKKRRTAPKTVESETVTPESGKPAKKKLGRPFKNPPAAGDKLPPKKRFQVPKAVQPTLVSAKTSSIPPTPMDPPEAINEKSVTEQQQATTPLNPPPTTPPIVTSTPVSMQLPTTANLIPLPPDCSDLPSDYLAEGY